MTNELTDLLAAGDADMNAVAGETLRFARGAAIKVRVRAVLTPDALAWSVELGGPQATQTAHIDVAAASLGAYEPRIGDIVQSERGTIYTITGVNRPVYDPAYHITVTKK